MTGRVFDIKRFAIHDGPGIRTSLFLKGCPLHCRWCQNPEGISLEPVLWYSSSKCIACDSCISVCPTGSLSAHPGNEHHICICHDTCELHAECVNICPTGALSLAGTVMTEDQAVHELMKDDLFFEESGGGVTLTGGDPLMQTQFSISILKQIKQKRIHTAIETCMYAPADILKQFIPVVDLFIVDLKIFDSELHKKYTGVNNDLILRNFTMLADSQVNILVRIPLIPGFTTREENLKDLEKFVSKTRGDIPIELINFNPLAKDKYRVFEQDYELAEVRNSFSEGEMTDFYAVIGRTPPEMH
ncbi:MAG: glycyl-radical enzyme activating protein [Bacteroidetes bacterium]|nr:glycyl-radical enzyme activating protein [Bacteroidota bacterium]